MGKIFLIGGAEDRKDEKYILRKIVDISKTKKIGVCSSALKENPLESYYSYEEAFKQLGVETIKIDIRNKEEAEYEENLDVLEKIDTIFFTGGDQVVLYDVFENTAFLKALKEKIKKGNINYCGTSAGSMVAAETMIYDGDYKGLVKGSLNSSEGFGLVKDIVIDTHFLHRIRMERICQGLLSGISNRGIGLPENGGIIIDGNVCEIVGENRVTFVDISNVKNNKYKNLKDGQKIPVNNLNVSLLNDGDKFDLKKWEYV